ncbi:rxt2-like protein [Colletotrichum plurivorum]|uniref:Rxt2-like protein n=1 Tax=Colletotrichum plurivorum TaxID=2175906 RepID=A0A8H6KGL7_9PEZI|nr:rxt2-like protein [Colletotrichum plurivorum]
MATQQILFAETVAAMKKALKRKTYESDSDDTIDQYGNRGHKLKKRALFSHQGQLAPPSGPEVYNEVIDYAGQQRTVISRNPPIVDEEGYEIDSDDDEERIREAVASATELDPYANLRIEQILAPLTASTDLPTHPTLSKPFTAKTLDEIADESCEIMRRENKSLWRVKHLFTRLCGDYTWVPCGMMVAPDDADLYKSDYLERGFQQRLGPAGEDEAEPPAATNGEAKPQQAPNGINGEPSGDKESGGGDGDGDGDVTMADAVPEKPEGRKPLPDKPAKDETKAEGETSKPPNGETSSADAGAKEADGDKKQKHKAAEAEPRHGSAAPPSHHGTEATDRNGHAPSTASDPVDETFVHPFFRPPPNAHPDRDLGLPDPEAEDIRRLLGMYLQKQEAVCRGAQNLHEGLLKANRLRKTVLAWSKAEAHSGPNRDMSDGEDWYDKEEWGLTEDLKKGQDDEEEDTGTVAKKTRNRR